MNTSRTRSLSAVSFVRGSLYRRHEAAQAADNPTSSLHPDEFCSRKDAGQSGLHGEIGCYGGGLTIGEARRRTH